jgi:hypothetical protein
MQVRSPNGTQFFKGGHDVGFDLFKSAENADALCLTEFVKFPT